MTKSEKAAATLRENKQKQREKEAAQRAEAVIIRNGLLSVMQSDDASPEEKIRAAELLLKLR